MTTTAIELPRLALRDHGRAPAIDVKDRIVWAREGGDVAAAYAELDQADIDVLYEDCVASFWSEAAVVAIAAGYDGVHSDGRSNGLLIPGGQHRWLDRTVADANGYAYDTRERVGEPFHIEPPEPDEKDTALDPAEAIAERERFMDFAREIAQLQTATENLFRERLREAVAELNTRREACIIRGEN